MTLQPENQLGVYPMDARQEEEEEEERLNEERLEARRFGLWFQELMECDSDIQTGGGRTRNTQGNEAFGDVQPPGGGIIITHDTARYFKRFQLRGREITLRIRQPHAGANVTTWLEGPFRDLLTHLTSHCEGGDYAGISFSASCLAHGPVWLSFRPVRAYTFVDIWQLITNIAQSAASLDIDDSFHIKPILNLRGAVGSLNFCAICNARSRRDHRCLKKKCPRCLQAPPCALGAAAAIRCETCNRDFFGEQCLENHRAITIRRKHRVNTVCESLQRCRKCFRAIRPIEKKTHVCGEGFCKTCKSQQPYNHLCYMRPIRVDERPKENIFIFYDFETQQCTPVKGDSATRVHEPNLCVAQRVCTKCCDNASIDEPCEHCGDHEFIFRTNPVCQLVELAIQSMPGFSHIFLIAHNADGFDAQFILRYFIEEKKTQLPSLIMNGTKIITMRVGKLVFLDSLNYFHMPLSALPKSFGLKTALAKGSFPHLFNRPENQNYIGPMPPAADYSPDTMRPEERERFFAWYNELKNASYVFNFSNELITYCKNDVTILRQACVVFRKMFMDSGRVCSFSENTTIASACFQICRKNFLKPNTIGIIPTGGYRWVHNQSKKAIYWLVWMEHSLIRRIIHAGRSREFKLPQNLLVDGYYETPDSTHVLQFHGCYWHGCLSCFTVNRDRVQSDGDTLNERLERTNAISQRIRSSGYTLTEIWECAYDGMIKTDLEMSAFVSDHPLVRAEPLNPRDAFFGGRTENMVTLYDVKDGEQIRYVDVCSLYPYICRYGKYPVGHPTVYVGDECRALTGPENNISLSRVEGLVKCTVLPLQNLYHPVLPVRMHQRLLFGLCRSCCETMNQDACPHEDPAERVFSGTWVVDELRKAIACGYKILTVSEIWQYEITQYNRDTQEGGLFTGYINTFLKIKQEASGWPEGYTGDETAQERYITSFKTAGGVQLERGAVAKNPGLRSVAKLRLNSFWGEFGQRENLPQTEIVSTREKLMELLNSPEHEITGMLPVNNQVLYVNYTKTDDAVIPSNIANTVIAAYTTAQARSKLYTYLEPLGKRALYCDTDSVIYVTRKEPGKYEPPTGQLLGDLTDELSCYGEGSYIKSFISGGPKFYSFIVNTPSGAESEVCKVKGITLNYANSSLINYESIRSFIIGERENPVVLQFDSIRRTPFHQVVTRPEKKSCMPLSVKRRRDGEYGSLPYGYK
ncbi:uncharacterized protein [Venturia canescens]|uniref:uncharacterized protein n=1 Tax=Venturia canescens TaxID=32260 RepID=UPI001C9D5CAA|nr:uncharacterized protein LOC122408943 [Venturia canescens]